MIFRKGNATDWTPDLDSKMVSWVQQYIDWLETSNSGIQESESAKCVQRFTAMMIVLNAINSNHGSFYYNQLAALKLIANDVPGALNVTETYFNHQYLNQIDANGTQVRTMLLISVLILINVFVSHLKSSARARTTTQHTTSLP